VEVVAAVVQQVLMQARPLVVLGVPG